MMNFIGTLKFGAAYNVDGKDKSKKGMISFTVADEIGNTFSCQMWEDDPQFANLAQGIEQMRFQPVQFTIKSYVSRMRTFKDGTERPQTNFIVANVSFPNAAAPASTTGA
ncbi:hypothetical protein KDA_70110 [Dictyobacter alpinus]|uniref:Single-stranded DNA-binding protein n=1 Tax=Dictyobacter alpinus TaxID=2014873 RepID=A0A402BJK4_9CHLR|nr:hypothetical protein [Dictyobacter alpinus]GCE31527.1 hypothetical protein KDA_70110 [Dictyobacter alpinus]